VAAAVYLVRDSHYNFTTIPVSSVYKEKGKKLALTHSLSSRRALSHSKGKLGGMKVEKVEKKGRGKFSFFFSKLCMFTH